jgi:serine/threonine protein kinase
LIKKLFSNSAQRLLSSYDSRLIIESEKFTNVEAIAQGSFGAVYRAHYQDTNRQVLVAIKTVKEVKVQQDKNSARLALLQKNRKK